MSANKLIFEVNGKPSFGKLLIFAFQQVLAVLAATILVPTIIGLPVQIPAAILGAGLGTIVYLLFTRFKSPVVISSSFAFLGALSNAIAFGYMGILLGGLFAGAVYVVIALIVRFVGTRWVEKLMPPVIIGPTVALIGLSLAGNATADMVTATAAGQSYNLVALFCGLVTFFTVVIFSVQNRFKTGRLIPFILGILAGYAVASVFTIFGNIFNVNYLKIIDWSPLVNNFKNITVESFITYPRFALIGGIKELVNGEVSAEILAVNEKAHVITGMGVLEVALAFVPVAFVTFAEHIADHKNLSSIINQNLLEEPGLHRTLLGDGVGSMAGAFFGGACNTTYGESVGCVAISGNASIRTIWVTAFLAILLSFFLPFSTLLASIPTPVMGGVCVALYGFIAVSGLKMIQKVDLGDNRNLFVVSVILIAGVGGFAMTFVLPNNAGTITLTEVACALILGIVVNLIVNLSKKDKEESPVEEPEEKVEE